MIADIQSSLHECDRYELSLSQLKREIARGVRYFWTRPDKPWRRALAERQDIESVRYGYYYDFGQGRVREERKKKAA